jgi:peptide/nickel transport system ATP-binding protein
MSDDPLLSVSHLAVRFADRKRSHAIVPDLSFELGSECLALVGESGSGKSLTARAVLGLLQPPLTAHAAHLRLGDVDLQRCSPAMWNRLRGSRLSLMLQDPRHSLNPVLRLGRQLDLALRVHQRLPVAERRDRIAAALEAVGLTQVQRVLMAYPQQLSGGMGQRVVLAMMLLNDPHVLIADEPTSALDEALREQVMELILGHVRRRRMGLLLISHDLQMVSRHADRALVMYRGRIIEQGPAAELSRSSHPYTRALWASRPSGRTHGTLLPLVDPILLSGDLRA